MLVVSNSGRVTIDCPENIVNYSTESIWEMEHIVMKWIVVNTQMLEEHVVLVLFVPLFLLNNVIRGVDFSMVLIRHVKM